MRMLDFELVYELDLPPFNEIVLPTFRGFDDDDLPINYVMIPDVKKIIKPEYCRLLNLDWVFMLYFKKSESAGSIHTDVVDAQQFLYSEVFNTHFGINWITDGSGKMEFWDRDEVKPSGTAPGPLNAPDIGRVLTFDPKTTPSKSYVMQENKAYLVNASYAHRATGTWNRKCYSMRTRIVDKPWNDVLEIFNELIIK